MNVFELLKKELLSIERRYICCFEYKERKIKLYFREREIEQMIVEGN